MINKIVIFILIFSFVHLVHSFPFELTDGRKCKSRNGNFPKPGSFCRSYYKCTNWIAKEMTCLEDQHFFPAAGYCVWPEEYPCLEKKPKNKECPHPKGKFLKPGSNCTKYYDCCNGVPTERRCGYGQLFDEDRGKCDWKELVVCLEDITTMKSTSKVTFTPSPTVPTTVSTTKRVNISTFNPTSPKVTTPDYETKSSEESSSQENSSKEDKITTPKFRFKSTPPSTTTFSSSILDEFSTTKDLFTPLITSTVDNNESSVLPDNLTSSIEPSSTTANSFITASSTSNFDDTSTTSKERETNSSDTFKTYSYPATVTLEITTPTFTQTDGSKDDVSTTMTSGISLSVSNSETTSEGTGTINNKDIFSTTSGYTDSATKTTTSTTSGYTDSAAKTTTSTTRKERNKDDVSTTGTSGLTDSVTGDIFCPKPTGYFPHPTNKHKFIACVGGNPTVMDCPSNLVYRHKKRSCEYE